MSKYPRGESAALLYYRLYVLYFEAPSAVLKALNKQAFYRISIWHKDEKIAEMQEGLNPVVLASKIFLTGANLNFHLQAQNPEIKAVLWYYFRGEEVVLGEAALNLQQVNDNFLQHNNSLNLQKNAQFGIREGHIRLVFNIFVERDKVKLDTCVQKFKEKELEMNRQRRIELTREKKSFTEALKGSTSSVRISRNKISGQEHKQPKILTKTSLVSIEIEEEPEDNPRDPLSVKKISSKDYFLNQQNSGNSKDSAENGQKTKQNGGSKEPPRFQTFESTFSRNDLEVESQVLRSRDSNLRLLAKFYTDLQEKGGSSSNSIFPREGPSKNLSMAVVGTTSVISDGSEASEMIANGSRETYSQRAVAKFKERMFKCLNAAVVILVLILLYILFVPSARYGKPAKISRGKISKLKDSLTQF